MFILMYAFQNAEGAIDGLDSVSVSIYETHAEARKAICDVARQWAAEKEIPCDIKCHDTEALAGWIVGLDEKGIPSLDFSIQSVDQLLKDQSELAEAASMTSFFQKN